MDTSVQGYAVWSKGEQLVPFTFSAPELGKNDVRVDVTHCGLCHTDIQAIEEFYDILYRYPFVPGHEIVGIVAEIGSAVSGVKVGERVGIGWQARACMQCEYCLRGEEQLCTEIVDAATWYPYGGFSTSVIADHRFTYPIPDGMPSATGAVLMCAGAAVYPPLQRYSDSPAQKLAILGMGGLGHLAIQFAHALGYEVTVISTSPDKKNQALEFGADGFCLANDPDMFKKYLFYFDLILCTATGKVPWDVLLNVPKKSARVIVASFPDMAMNPTDLVAHELSITGAFLSNRANMRKMLAFGQAHHITPLVEIMPMQEVNRAIERARENKARYRIVLVNEP